MVDAMFGSHLGRDAHSYQEVIEGALRKIPLTFRQGGPLA